MDKKNRPLPDIPVNGRLSIVEGVWNGESWSDAHHDVPIPVKYDPKQKLYISSEVSNIEVASRWKGLHPRCRDRITGVQFFFNAWKEHGGIGDGRRVDLNEDFFGVHFRNSTINQVSLPDQRVPIKIVLDEPSFVVGVIKEERGSDFLLTTDTGERIEVWPSNRPENKRIIEHSLKSGLRIKIYGYKDTSKGKGPHILAYDVVELPSTK